MANDTKLIVGNQVRIFGLLIAMLRDNLVNIQVPENWLLGINYSVNEINRFELNEIVIIQRSDGRKTFASICNIDAANNEYECKVI